MTAIQGGVRVQGFIAPTSNTDTYPVTDPHYGLGGLRTVLNLGQRDQIPAERRVVGMLVFVQQQNKYYKLLSDLVQWEEVDLSNIITSESDPTVPQHVKRIAAGTTVGQILRWNGNDWVLATLPTETDPTVPTHVKQIPQGNANGQALQWNGTQWTAAAPPTGGIATETDPTVPTHVKQIPAGNADGQVLQWNGTQWTAAAPPTGGSDGTWFGDGSDGDVTINSNTIITRDMYYNNLTVNAGALLNTNDFRVFVKNQLTINGVIGRPGNNATNNGGTPGFTAAGTIYCSSGSGGAGATIVTGSSVSNSLGGSGGKGGNGYTSSESGAAGGVAIAPNIAAGGLQVFKNIAFAYALRFFNINTVLSANGGAGGGSGWRLGGSSTSPGISGGAGGGGAAIYANKITGTGTISCKGGNGGSATWGTGGSIWGGGGGGGGGWIVLVTSSPFSSINNALGTAVVSGTVTITVQGGTGGLGYPVAGPAYDGENGQPGRMFLFNV